MASSAKLSIISGIKYCLLFLNISLALCHENIKFVFSDRKENTGKKVKNSKNIAKANKDVKPKYIAIKAPSSGLIIERALGITKNLLIALPIFSSLVLRMNSTFSGIQDRKSTRL